MKNRRDFLKSSVAVAIGMAIGAPKKIFAFSGYFSGMFYTKENPGKWAGKEGSLAPKVTVEGKKVTVKTPHPMTEKHYIVRHTLVSADGKVLGEKTFYPSNPKAISTYELPEKHSSKVYATSFCNLHDLWVTEFNV